MKYVNERFEKGQEGCFTKEKINDYTNVESICSFLRQTVCLILSIWMDMFAYKCINHQPVNLGTDSSVPVGLG